MGGCDCTGLPWIIAVTINWFGGFDGADVLGVPHRQPPAELVYNGQAKEGVNYAVDRPVYASAASLGRLL